MQEGTADGNHRSITRWERLRNLCPDLPSRLLLELIRSINPERVAELGEIFLVPSLESFVARELSTLLEGADYNQRQFAIMAVLLVREPEPVIALDLAYALGIPIGTVRGCLSELEKAGAVSHQHSHRHRRRTYVTLTDCGRMKIARGLVIFLAALESIAGNLPQSTRIVLAHLYGVMRANASRHLLRASKISSAPQVGQTSARATAGAGSVGANPKASDTPPSHLGLTRDRPGRSAAG